MVLTGGGWAILWGVRSSWNPLAFTALWSGAALVLWSLSAAGYPSLRRHLALASVSVPLWWWFELVNARVASWEYLYEYTYTSIEYAAFSSLAFATVVPALVAATALVRPLLVPPHEKIVTASRSARTTWLLIALGVGFQAGAFAFPRYLYPLVWVAPFLVLDGLVALAGGRSLIAEIRAGRWREAAAIGCAGLLCGVLWELWNFSASPKWVYSIPHLDFGRIFEMPVLGYGGYVPFAWSVLQLVRLVDLLGARATFGGSPLPPLVVSHTESSSSHSPALE